MLAFEDLIDFFYSHLKVNKNAHIYHYNSYEETALKKLSQKYETKIFEVDFILRENKLVDLYKVVKDSVILSSENYRLKTIFAIKGNHYIFLVNFKSSFALYFKF